MTLFLIIIQEMVLLGYVIHQPKLSCIILLLCVGFHFRLPRAAREGFIPQVKSLSYLPELKTNAWKYVRWRTLSNTPQMIPNGCSFIWLLGTRFKFCLPVHYGFVLLCFRLHWSVPVLLMSLLVEQVLRVMTKTKKKKTIFIDYANKWHFTLY